MRASFVSLVLCLVGCQPLVVVETADGGPEPDLDSGPDRICLDGACYAQRCRGLTYFEGDAEPGLVIGELRDEEVVPWEDGQDVTYEWGFQGGTMILPSLEIPASVTSGDGCVQVRLRHREDPAHPGEAGDAPSHSYDWTDPMRRSGDRLQMRHLNDQIGWDAPDGHRFVLEAEVRGVDFALRGEVSVRAVDEDGFDECDTIPTEYRFGCEVWMVTGAVTVDAVGDGGDGCDDLLDVTLTMAPEATYPDGCVPLTRTLEFSRGCVEAHGLTPGAVVEDAYWELPASGSCGELESAPSQRHCSCP
ncbi:MAG: hypothetical protein VYE22_29850 [Myxococcota bacterium]|nr:hypothetical protein [Myxococcota bacterium]